MIYEFIYYGTLIIMMIILSITIFNIYVSDNIFMFLFNIFLSSLYTYLIYTIFNLEKRVNKKKD